MIQFNVPVKYSLLLMTGNCGPQSCFFFFSSALCWLYIFFSSFFPVTLKIKHRPSSYKCLHQNAYWLQFCGFRVLKVYPCRIGCNIRFFDHFQLPTCGGNNKCQSLKAQRKPSWHWIVVIILFPSLWNELCICLGTINGIQLDLNVAVLFSTFKLLAFESCASRTQSQGEIISYVAHIGKRRISKSFYSWSPIIFLGFHFWAIWITKNIAIDLVCCQVSSVNNFTI